MHYVLEKDCGWERIKWQLHAAAQGFKWQPPKFISYRFSLIKQRRLSRRQIKRIWEKNFQPARDMRWRYVLWQPVKISSRCNTYFGFHSQQSSLLFLKCAMLFYTVLKDKYMMHNILGGIVTLEILIVPNVKYKEFCLISVAVEKCRIFGNSVFKFLQNLSSCKYLQLYLYLLNFWM